MNEKSAPMNRFRAVQLLVCNQNNFSAVVLKFLPTTPEQHRIDNIREEILV